MLSITLKNIDNIFSVNYNILNTRVERQSKFYIKNHVIDIFKKYR